MSLRLSPASNRGWFGGRGFSADFPASVRGPVSLVEAAEALEASFTGSGPALTAALVTYEGDAVVATYDRFSEGAGAEGGACGSAVPAGSPLLEGVRMGSGIAYRAGVEAVRERIAAGDVYVLNLTHVLEGAAVFGAREAHAALLARAGSDMSALFQWPGGAIASVSPERFLRVRAREGGSREAEIQPIKGTAPRGASPADDEALAAGLAADPKERAEHVMVVDLERNDLGRVSLPGSVRVDPLYEVVATPYCHQLVSRVRGDLRPGATFAEVLEATFPCGSVTGAPKAAAMRIAAELEDGPRGAYCGALLVAIAGEMDSSVLIRTLEYMGRDTPGSVVRWGAGCGITHESEPGAEWLESLLKASPVLGDGRPPVALRETARVEGGQAPLLAYHFARLSEGGCGPSLLADVRVAIEGALRRWGRAAVGRLGVTVTPDGAVTAEVTGHVSTLDVEGGPRLAVVDVEGAPALPPGAAKPAARRAWDRAHAAARLRGADQAVLAGPGGVLIDGSTATLWLRDGRRLLTPPAPPAVAGVMRAVVFALAPGAGLDPAEARITLEDLDGADEVFLSNAYGGIVPARDRDGEARRALAEVLRERYRFG